MPSLTKLFSRGRYAKRFGNAVTSRGTLNLRHASYSADFTPVDEECACPICLKREDGGLGITKAYIYHVAGKETAGAHLLTMHNVYYLLDLMKGMRASIIEDRFPQFVKDFFGRIYDCDKTKYPVWAVEALKKVGVDLLE